MTTVPPSAQDPSPAPGGSPGPAPRVHPRRFTVAVRSLIGFGVLLVVCGVVLGVRLGTSGVQALRSTPFTTPAARTVHLAAGSWVLFERTGSSTQVGPVSTYVDGPVHLTPSDVSVEAGDTVVTVEPLHVDETLTEGGAIYTGAVSFRIPRAGDYELIVSGRQGMVRLAPDIGASFAAVAWWGAGAGIAFLGVLVSGALALASRRRLTPAMPTGLAPVTVGAAPPGWYPDPRGTGALLWWDGHLWRVPREPGARDDDPHPVGPAL